MFYYKILCENYVTIKIIFHHAKCLQDKKYFDQIAP